MIENLEKKRKEAGGVTIERERTAAARAKQVLHCSFIQLISLLSVFSSYWGKLATRGPTAYCTWGKDLCVVCVYIDNNKNELMKWITLALSLLILMMFRNVRRGVGMFLLCAREPHTALSLCLSLFELYFLKKKKRKRRKKWEDKGKNW